MAGFSETMDALWAVQKHDALIVKEQARIAKGASGLAAEQARADAAKAKLDTERDKHRQLKTRHKELEGELLRFDARVKQLEAQGTQVGSQGAAKQRAKIDEMENEGLTLLMQVGAQEIEALKAEQELKMRQEVLAQLTLVSGAAARASQQVIDATGEVRRLAIAPIAPEVLQVYDEVNTRHPGSAMSRIEGEYCAACQSTLNTQLLMQVRARREILRCPQCLRILDAPPK